jgi:hypothetical protein
VNVDWDLLADHLDGALDGTPEGARVARLVATDPGWARAAAALSTALDAVGADLRTLPDPRLPDDVAARLARALREPSPESGGRAPLPAPRAGASPSPGHPGGGTRRPAGRPGRRQRLARWAGGLAVAAGIAAFAAVGTAVWQPSPSTVTEAGGDRDAATTDGLRAENHAEGGVTDDGGGPTVLVATGTEYQASELATAEPPPSAAPTLGSADRPGPAVEGPGPAAEGPSPPAGHQTPVPTRPDSSVGGVPAQVPPSLVRLWSDPRAREACLAAIRTALRPAPVTIDTVDFARFQDEDALVIWATTADAVRWVSVAGPECGIVAGDPAVRFQNRLS